MDHHGQARLQGRVTLTANTTYYVSTTGNDSTGNGSSGNPWLTLQHAWNVITTFDLGGYTATIQLADGTYTGGLFVSSAPIGGNVVINGNTTTPANVIVTSSSLATIRIACPIQVTLQNFEVRNSAVSTYGVQQRMGLTST